MSAALPRRAIRAAGIGLLLLLGGCVVQMGFTNPQQRAAALALFRTGQATLSCLTTQCLIAWNATRPTARETADANDLEDLAALVLAADYDNDLGYYYLGMAAAGLGYREAARTYLDRAIQHSFAGGLLTCQPVACDGFDLPNDARVALASLPRSPVARTVRRRPSRQIAPASATRRWVDPTQPGAGREMGAPASAPGWVAPVPGNSE